MNYRHIYHAGNFADVVKHIILSRVILYMQRKEKAFRVLDTHAGIGLYDLSSVEAQKTGEWQGGIALVMEAFANAPKNVKPLIEPYLDVVRSFNEGTQGIQRYPGSPLITRTFLRNQDRLTALELHPDDFETLQTHFEGDYQARITHLDGWLGLKSHLPPKERRGITLVDPPFEVFHEFFNHLKGITNANERFAGGTHMMWYPVKNRKACDEFRTELYKTRIPAILDVSLEVRRPKGLKETFDGTGLAIVNPPYTLEQELKLILPWLKTVLEENKGSGQYTVNWINKAL
jgi:23S rRNA (adenine2030-N6)-methyltransferase